MTLSIDATQDKRRQASHIRPIILVTIEVTKPSSTTYRFSHNVRTYSSNTYLDYLLEVSEIVEAINHFDSEAIPSTLSIRLQNGPYGSGTLLDEFLSVTYENAKVTIQELLLGPSESRAVPTSSGPVTRFVGRVRLLSDIDDQSFTLQCVDERMNIEDAVDWYAIDEADPSPEKEINKRLPKPYGAGVLVPCVAYDVGALTTLAEDITESTTGNVKVTETAELGSSGSLMIGAEKVTYGSKSDVNRTVNISARGQSGGGAAVVHLTGETVLELQTNNYWVAGEGTDLKSVNRVFFRATNGELVDITSLATIDVANTTLISGRTVASILLDNADLEAIKQLDNVTQQGGGYTQVQHDESYTETQYSPGGSYSVWRTLKGWEMALSSNPKIEYDSGGVYTKNRLRRWWVLGKSTGTEITRFRLGVIAQVTGGVSNFGPELHVMCKGPTGGGSEEAEVTLVWTAAQVNGVVTQKNAQSSWVTVLSQPKTLNDLVNASKTTDKALVFFETYSNGLPTAGTNPIIEILNVSIEYETQGGDKSVASFGGAFNLDIYADVDGFKVPAADTTYSVVAGTLIEKDYDIARHILQKQASVSSADLASDWNTEGALDATNITHALLLNDLGTKLSDCLATLGNESRLNIYPEAGKWKIRRRRLSAPGYTAGTLTFSNANVIEPGFDVSIRPLEEIWNILSARYDPDRSITGSDDEIYAGRVEGENAASKTKFGNRKLDPYNYQTVAANAVAQDTLNEALQEHRDRRYTVSWTSPYYDTFLLELGDLVKVQLPFLSSTIDVRVLEIRRNLEDQVARITGIEVLTS